MIGIGPATKIYLLAGASAGAARSSPCLPPRASWTRGSWTTRPSWSCWWASIATTFRSTGSGTSGGANHGVDLPGPALLRPVMAAADLLDPLARLIGEELKGGGPIQADETRVPVPQRDGKERNDTAWLWQYSRPAGLVYFDYQDSRGRAGPGAFLSGFTGRLQSDSYEVYIKVGDARPRPTTRAAGRMCGASSTEHTRRRRRVCRAAAALRCWG